MKISGALPKGHPNGLIGLDHIASAQTDIRHVVIAVLSVKKIVTDVDSGDTEAQMRLDRIERVLPQDATVAEQLFRRSLQKRSGETTLDIEVEDDISAIFREALLNVHGDDPTGPAAGKDKTAEPDDDPTKEA